MTDQDPHVATEQETVLYEALGAGDHDAIADARLDAYSADQAPPDPEPDDWRPPIEQYEVDYAHAWSHYQGDHEPPEDEREEQTAEAVQEDNADAAADVERAEDG